MNALMAARAYAAAAGNAAPMNGASPAGEAGGFADLLKAGMEQATQSTRAAETQMQAHAAGRAELIDVVTSVASAEASLETVMAVRDQVIQAYQEIMRMPI